MRTQTDTRRVAAPPEDVIDVLTDPGAAARWSPVPFELEDGGPGRLEPGVRARVHGVLAGLRVSFEVEVQEADAEVLRLSADGPVGLEVRYDLWALEDGTEIVANVRVAPGRGLTGRALSRATEALLGAGALGAALTRIADEAERLVPC